MRPLEKPTRSSLTGFARSSGRSHGRRHHAAFEILVRDSQSSPNRCAEVASELIKSDKIDLMVVAGTPETVNPVSDQCEVNQVPCVSTDAPWQPYFFGRGGNPAKGFDWTYHFFWGAEAVSQVMCRNLQP